MTSNVEHLDQIVVRDDHHCFGCGRLNPFGLRLQFYRTDSGVLAPFVPVQRHEGYAGVVHGGIVTTVLDEVMAWALYAQGIWAVTGELRVRFRLPVEVGVPTVATGQLVTNRGRIIEVAGELRRADDATLLAMATATFVRVPDDQAQAWRNRYLTEDAS